MVRRRTPVARQTSRPSQTGVRLHAAGERLATLLKRRDRLLSDVRKKQAALRAATEEAASAAERIVEGTAPLIPKFDQLREELRTLFLVLLAPGRLAARTRKKVVEVHQALIDQGLIPEWGAPVSADGDEDDDDEFEGAPFDDAFDFDSPPFANDDGAGPRVAAAPQHGQAPGRDSLRTLFRRLVLALHPDRAQHDLDRARRTEAMKEATRAYEDGDLARLLELEKSWQTGARISAGPDDDGRRCAELEQTIRELNRQSRELSRDIREVKLHASEEMLDVPTQCVVQMAEDELAELTAIRDFVKDFSEGRMTLAEFMKGPMRRDQSALELEAVLEELMMRADAPPRRRSNARAGRRGR